MIEMIWSALDFWQRFGVIVLGVMIPVGLIAEAVIKKKEELV